jgi:hypothetical protein
MNATCQRSRIGPKRCRRKSTIERKTSGGIRVALCDRCDKKHGWIVGRNDQSGGH